jgi:transcription elongation factor Elf1
LRYTSTVPSGKTRKIKGKEGKIMTCIKCQGNNVNITTEQIGGKSKIKKVSVLTRLGRLFMIFMTVGLWILVPKRVASQVTNYNHKTVALCQTCGTKWEIKTDKHGVAVTA